MYNIIIIVVVVVNNNNNNKCMHMLIWNYNGCTSHLMLLLMETRVIHRFREQRLRERASPSFSFFYSQIYFVHARA